MKKNTVTFLKLTVSIIIVGTLFLFIFLPPWLADHTAGKYPNFAYMKYPVLIGIYTTTIPFYIALFKAYRILDNIRQGDAFSEKSVGALKLIKQCAIAEVILYAVLVIYLLVQNAWQPGILVVIGAIMFAAFTISLFAAVLEELFIKALQIKAENDLTV